MIEIEIKNTAFANVALHHIYIILLTLKAITVTENVKFE